MSPVRHSEGLAAGASPAQPSPTGLLRWVGLALLALCAAAMLLATLQRLSTAEASEARARAELVASAVATRIQRALEVGIPLERLEGVDALFAVRMQASAEIAGLGLAATDGRMLHGRRRDGANALPDGPRVQVPVKLEGREVAQVVLVWRPPGAWSALRHWALPLLVYVLAFSCAAALLLRWRQERVIAPRERVLALACHAAAGGDYSPRIPLWARRQFDRRAAWLTAQLRHVNESQLRLWRLVHSLRQTEPDALRRAELDALLHNATAGDHFRGEGAATPVQPDLPAPPVPWLSWLTVALGVALPPWALLAPSAAPLDSRWLAGGFAVLAAALVVVMWRAAPQGSGDAA